MPMMINMARIHFLLIIAISIEVILAGDVIRDPRSIGVSPTNNSASKEDAISFESPKQVTGGKIVQLLVGGHLKLNNVTTTTTTTSPIPSSRLETLKMESAGAGKDKETKDDDDEEKKTLAQQVVEGKYGLIQKELFEKHSKRFGIISYAANPEVPKDTKSNLGGLDPDDIWLAEDHLLVLKGGKFPEHNSKDDVNVNWPPIDDYKAPRRQVKIPINPKVPPPFPVQLKENGPVEFIGPNGSTRAIPANFGPPYPPEGFIPGSGPFFPNTIGDTPFPIRSFAGNSSQGNGKISPPPFPVRARQQPLPNVSPEFIASLPPGAAYLPPPNNQTDFYDEDDPSIYYPPPYSFYYPKENSTNNVPPGPLVPGIILPPPPDFFSQFEKDERKNKTTTTEQTTQIHPTPTSILSPTSEHIEPIYIPDDIPDKPQINIPSTIDYENDIKPVTTPIPTISHTPTPQTTPKSVEKNVYYSTEPAVFKYTSIGEGRKKIKYLKPTVSTTPAYYDYSDNYYENNAVTQNSKPSYGPPPPEKVSRFRYNNALRTLVSTTAVPLRAYFTTSEEIESNSVTALPKQGSRYRHGGGLLTTRASPKINTQSQPASYFYYEEDPAVTTVKNHLYQNYGGNIQTPSQQTNYYNNQQIQPEFVLINSKQQPYYNARQRDQYSLLAQTVRPEVINSQIARLKEEIQSYLTTPKPIYPPYRQQNSRIPTPFQKPSTSNPVYEYSFQAANYQQQNFKNSPLQNDNEDQFRPIVGYNISYKPRLNPVTYQTTPSPIYVYNKHETNTVRPSQSSYQSADSSEYEYDDDTRYQQVAPQMAKVTERPIVLTQYLKVLSTANPVNHAYYTTQDERLFDDRTKQYFNVFGQKIPSGDKIETATQPLKNQVDVTSEKYNNANSPVKIVADYKTPRPIIPSRKQQYQQNQQSLENYKNPSPAINTHSEFNSAGYQDYQQNKQPPISLGGDTNVNYKNPRPPINPDSEFIPINNQQYQQHKQSLEGDTAVNYKNPRPPINPNSEFISAGYRAYQQNPQPPISLGGDTDVNYKNPRPPINPDSEFIPINQQYQQNKQSLEGDTDVNYKNPRPPINPDSEFIPVGNRQYHRNELLNSQHISIGADNPSAKYNNPSINTDSEFIPINRPYQQNHLSNSQGASLESDIAVNYKNPPPAINPDAELINPNAESLEQYSGNNQNQGQIETFDNKQTFKSNPNAESYDIYNIVPQQRVPQNSRYLNHQYIQQRPANYHRQNTRQYENIRQANNNVGEGRPGSFISYQLPGNGAHFYFLTPRVVSPQQRQNQPIPGYYYPQQEGSRLRRSRIRQPTRSR